MELYLRSGTMSDLYSGLDSILVAGTGTTHGSPPETITWIDDFHTAGVDSGSIANQEQTKLHWEEVLSSPDVRLFPTPEEPKSLKTQNVNIAEFRSTVDSNPISIGDTRSLWEKTFTDNMDLTSWETQHNNKNASYLDFDNYRHVDSNDNLYEMKQDMYLQTHSDGILEYEKSEAGSEDPPPPLPNTPPPTISQAMFNEMTEADRGSELLKNKSVPDQYMYMVDQQLHSGPSEHVKEYDQESIVEREIREQQMREREVQKQHKSVYEIESTDVKVIESELPSATAAYTPPEVRPVVHISSSLHNLELPVQKSSPSPPVVPTPSTPVVVVSKPVMSAVYKTDQNSRPKTHGGGGGAYSHAGESLIAREIREQKERESELRQHWKNIGLESPYKEPAVSETPFSLPEPVRVMKSEVQFETQQEREFTPSSAGHSQRVLDDINDGDDDVFDGREPRLESRAPMVKPLLDALSELEQVKPYKYEPTNETAVEREVRLAKEREDELRRMKGLPVANPTQQKGDLIVEFGSNEAPAGNEQQRPYLKYKKGHEGDDKGNLKRFFASKIQQELEREKEREQDLKSTGRIKTVSEEYKELKKYRDVMVDESPPMPPSLSSRSPKASLTYSYPLTPAVSYDSQHWKPKKSTPVVNAARDEQVHDTEIGGQESPDFSAPVTAETNDIVEAKLDTAVEQFPTVHPSESESSSVRIGGWATELSTYHEYSNKESIIERELREMREREAELRRQRNIVSQRLVTQYDAQNARAKETKSVQKARAGHDQQSAKFSGGHDQQSAKVSVNSLPAPESSTNSTGTFHTSLENAADQTNRAPRRKSTLAEQWEKMVFANQHGDQ